MLQAVCYVFACIDPFWILPHFALKPQNSGIVVRYQCNEMYNGTPTASCGDDGMYMVSGMIRPLLSLSFTYIWKQNDFDWCHVHPFAIICHISTSIAIGVLTSNSRRPWLEGVVPLGATMEAAAAVSVGHLQRSTMLHRGEKSTIYRDGGWMVIDEMIWNFNGFHVIYWFHSFLFSSFWYLLLGFFWCKLIQIICSSLHSAATWSPFHISWSFFLGGLWFYLILQIHIIIGTVPIHDGKSIPLIGNLVPGSTTPMSRVAGLWACVVPTFATQAASHMCLGRLLLSDGLYGHREVFSVKFLHLICKKTWRYEGSYWSNIDITDSINVIVFALLAVLFGIFNLTPGYHGFVTAVCEEAGVIDDLLGQWPLNRFASQIVRVETTVSLGIVRLCCVVHRPSCRRCRVDWGLITFITSYPHRHQARPQLVWKMSPSRTSALAHLCTTLVSSQGMLWWPRTDVWMNAKGTCFSSAKQGNPQTIPNTKHHSTRSLMSWWCVVLAVDCVESVWVMILFLRSVLPILLLGHILRGSVAWSFGNTSRYRGRAAGALLAHQPLGDQWQLPGGATELTLFFWPSRQVEKNH